MKTLFVVIAFTVFSSSPPAWAQFTGGASDGSDSRGGVREQSENEPFSVRANPTPATDPGLRNPRFTYEDKTKSLMGSGIRSSPGRFASNREIESTAGGGSSAVSTTAHSSKATG